MTVYSLTLNKADYKYSISYHQGNDDLTLDTNDEALNSMDLAIGALEEAVRQFAEVGDNYEVEITKVKFGDENKASSISFITSTFSRDIWPKKVIRSAMSISQPGKGEKEVAADRAKVLINILGLYSEVEKYLSGQRAQQDLFDDDEEDPADVEIEDIPKVEDDDTPGFEVFE